MKRLAAGIVWLAVALAPLRGGAASLDVSPVVVELSAHTPSALVGLKNTGKEPVRVQLRAHTWDESAKGEMILGDTVEVSAYPPLQQLAAGEERKIRIGTTAKPGARERSWRVFIEELPGSARAGEGAMVHLRTRIGIPVFLAPVQPATAGELVIAKPDAKLELRLRNTGSVRIPPTAVELVLLGEKDEQLERKTLQSWYVLAGGERLIAVDVEPGTCAKVRRAVATATLGERQLQAVLALPSGACAP